MNTTTAKANNSGWQPYFGVFRGIVIDNQDTQIPHSGRVQVFIPDIHSINLVSFFADRDNVTFKFPGENIIGDLTPDMVNYLRTICPWATPCAPIIGETGPGLYNDGGFASATEIPCDGGSDQNAPAGFNKPSSQYEDPGKVNDVFSEPRFSLTARANTFGNEYRAPSYSNAPKGVYGIPRVGAQLLLSFLKGDCNFPVYIGSMPSTNEYQQIFQMDGTFPGAPGGYESLVKPPASSLPTKSVTETAPQPNVNTDAPQISKQPEPKPSALEVERNLDKVIEKIREDIRNSSN